MTIIYYKMNFYKKKYEKYKLKYIKLKKKFDFDFDKTKNSNIENIVYNFKKETKEDNNYFENINDKEILNKQKLYDKEINKKLELLQNKVSIYNTENDKSIIDKTFAEKIINGSIDFELDNDNILNLNIKTEVYHSINIRNNTLSLPGMSILLVDKIKDEWDVGKIHEFLKDKNKIKGKHILFMPFQTDINGILLEDLLKILDLNNVNSNNNFIVNVNLQGQNILNKIMKEQKKSRYGTINTVTNDIDYKDIFNYNDNDDYVDIEHFLY